MSDVEGLAVVLRAHRCTNGFMPPGDTESVVWRKYACTCGWWSTADQEADFTTHVAQALAARVQAARAEALEEAADRWTQGAWSDVMLPKPTPPAVPVIAYANRMGDWLRARAAALRADDAGGEGL